MQARRLLAIPLLLAFLWSTQAAAPAAASAAGTFEGEYNSTATGAQGRIRIQLREEGGNWSGEVSAVYNNSELPTRVVKVEVKENKLALTFSVDVENMSLQILLSGTLTGDAWAGTYDAVVAGSGSPVDSGSWKAARK
jgi:hypothetical protein